MNSLSEESEHPLIASNIDSSRGRVVIGGGGGFMGRYFAERYRSLGREVVTIGRRGADLTWDDTEGIARAIDGAALVIGLAGKSVNCRYTPANRAEIFRSRTSTTAALSQAIQAAKAPPPLWVNSSTATIYRHAEDRPMTESTGELGEGFSVEVAKRWEEALFADDLSNTRRVALRSAIVLGDGGVFATLRRLARLGLGGAHWDGRWPISKARQEAQTGHVFRSRCGSQKFSWVHIDDVALIIDFLEKTPTLSGPVNVAARATSTDRDLMRTVRRAVGMPLHFPLMRWMQEIGAAVIKTETELVLKSRWVVPEKLERAGYEFKYPELDAAIRASL